MTSIKLSKRLSLIASMVDKNSVVADIGCDHALLDIYLVQNKIVKKSIACDITEGALNQAKKNILISNVNKIDVRLGDGLKPISLKDNVDTIIISGLGNIKIKEILENDISKLSIIKTIIIQSNTGIEKIRQDVIELGYYIENEAIVKENGIIYVVIKFYKGKQNYTKKQIFFGPKLLENKNDLFNEMICERINKNKKIISNLPKNKFIKKVKLVLLNIKMKKEVKKDERV